MKITPTTKKMILTSVNRMIVKMVIKKNDGDNDGNNFDDEHRYNKTCLRLLWHDLLLMLNRSSNLASGYRSFPCHPAH